MKLKLRTEKLEKQPRVWKRGKQNLLFRKSYQKHNMYKHKNHFILEDEEAGLYIYPEPVDGSLQNYL